MKIYSKGGILLGEVNEVSYSGAFMGERFVSCTVQAPVPIQFLPGDYIDYRGERFVLDYTPTDKKTSSPGSIGDAFQYDLKFVSLKQELEKCLFLDVVLNDNEIHYTGLSEVQVFGDAKVLADRIIANLNRLYKGEEQWNIQVLKETDAQNISLSDSNCWDAVALFKSLFGLNFTVYGREIKVGTVGKKIEHTFQYGSGQGLTEIVRTAVSGEAVVSRLKAYGGNRNIPRDYNKKGLVPESQYIPNLMLPGYTETLIDYIESDNTSIYGIREAVFKDEEIYPSIAGVTADDLKAAGITTMATGRIDEIVYMEPIKRDDQATFNVWIKDIGFNIKNHLTPTTALISMRDGNLGGYEFEITNVIRDSSVEGAAYSLTLNRNQDDNFILPDEKTFIKPGDHFVLLEIYMPEVYVKTAEQRLLTKAQEYLAEYDHVKATYSVNMDKVFMVNHPTIGDTMYEGDLLRVVDTDLQLDREIIIQNLTIKDSGIVPEYTVTLSDDPVATTLNRVQDNISEIEQTITANKVDGVKEARRRAIELQLLKTNIFDPDGEINDTFLQTMMLQVGANSMNYQMGKTTARPHLVNMSFTNTTINLGADDVIHFAYGAGEEKASTWHITTPFSGSGLNEAKTYFVAIKASRDNLNAEWIVDENTYGVESVPGYYIFNFGILSEVTDGQRFFSETRGNIYAYGDELSAGVISSIDRYSWFNLNTGDFQLYNKVTGDGLSFKNGKLTLGGNFNPETGEFGSTIQGIENSISEQGENVDKINKDLTDYKETTNQNLETLHAVTDDLQSQVDGNIMAWDGDYIPTLSNFPASEWDTDEEKARHKGDYFDRTFMQDGQKVTERYKFIQDNGVYQWLPIADSSSALALQEAREALGIAGSKAKLFYGDTIPTAPYDINDVWVKQNGTILLSNAERAEGYGQNEADWKVVNDTQVRLAQMSSDGVISKEEKATIRNEKSQIDKEYQKYAQDATSYGVDITELKNAYDSLVNFLLNIIKINEDTDFTFTGLEQQNQYNQSFANYYAARTSFANTIASKITETGISNVQIGSVNILNNSKVQFGNFVAGGSRILQTDITLKANKAYTFTAQCSGAVLVRIGKYDPAFWASVEFTATDVETVKSVTFIPTQDLTNVFIEGYTWTGAGSEKRFCDWLMLVEGNKAPTTWSPSLADQKEDINQGKLFIRGTGFNNNAGRIFKINNSDSISKAGRGLNLITINRNTLQIIDNIIYDTWGSSSDVINLINKLNSLSSDVIITLTSYDDIYHEWTSDLTKAIEKCGGFGVGPSSARCPYAFIGIAGIGKGNGIEVISGSGANDPYAEISTQIINGIPTGVAIGKSSLAIEAQKNLDALQIGIRNLIRHSKEIRTNINQWNNGYIDQSNYIPKTLKAGKSYVADGKPREGVIASLLLMPSNQYVSYRQTFIPTADVEFLYIRGEANIIGIVDEFIITEGNKSPSNWVPAIEDTQEQIDDAKENANSATEKATQALEDATAAQQQSNKAISDAQEAANAAAEADKKAAEAADSALKAYNDAQAALTQAQNLDYLKAAFGDINTEIAKGVVLAGVIAVKDRNENVVAGIAGTIPLDPNINNYPAIFAGATKANDANNAKVAIYADGSGWLAGKSISWDAAGNATFTGKITSNSNGGRIIIDPNSRSLSMITSANIETLRLSFFKDTSQISLFSADDADETVINPSGIDIYTSGQTHYSWIRAAYATFKVSQMVINLTAAANTGKEMYILGLDYFRNVGETDRWATLMVHRKTGRIAMSETPD